MPIPREHLLAVPKPPKITPEDRLFMKALHTVNNTDEYMSHSVWLHHLSRVLSIPNWQCAILWKRLENEKKITFHRKLGYKPLYLAVNKRMLGEPITTLEQYNYKFPVEDNSNDNS